MSVYLKTGQIIDAHPKAQGSSKLKLSPAYNQRENQYYVDATEACHTYYSPRAVGIRMTFVHVDSIRCLLVRVSG